MHEHTEIGWLSVIGLIVGIFLFAGQLVVSILTGSIALLSDTFHVLGDNLAILVVGGSQLMAIIAHRFGGHEDEEDYHNVELAATAFNGLLLIGIGIWLFYLAMGRLTDPPEVSSVIWIPGLIGLTVNLSMVALFWRQREHLVVESAIAHYKFDSIASVGVIVAGVLIITTGEKLVDPLVSVFIIALIMIWGVRLIGKALRAYISQNHAKAT